MKTTPAVQKILENYAGDSAATKANLARILNSGELAGTGKMIIYPVDQGFEHGPDRSFAMNPEAYDPHYHHELALASGCNAYAAPLGMLELTAPHYAKKIPLILKINSANSLTKDEKAPTQAVTGSVSEAVRLGCSAIGYTIYPGSEKIYCMLERLRDLAAEAKAAGLVVIVWSYARGAAVSKEGELALDVVSYGAHMAALMGAHIIKVKLPSAYIEQPEARKNLAGQDFSQLSARVAHVKRCCFARRRLVVFSGGAAKGTKDVLDDTRAIAEGGGDGSIIGRNCFQRPRKEALTLIGEMIQIYQRKNV